MLGRRPSRRIIARGPQAGSALSRMLAGLLNHSYSLPKGDPSTRILFDRRTESRLGSSSPRLPHDMLAEANPSLDMIG